MKRALLALLLVTACGTTVPATVQRAASDPQGLEAPQPTATTTVPAAAPSLSRTQDVPRSTVVQAIPGATALPTEATTSAPVIPVQVDRTPLKVGITFAKTGPTALALGAQDNSVNGKSTAEALVRSLNAAGGLHGRKLVPVLYGWDTSSNSYSSDAQAACESFTRDNHVAVVLDSVFGTIGGFGSCLQKAGVLHLTSTTEGDRESSSQRTLHANPQIMVDDRTYSAVLQGLTGTGYLSRANQLGIVVEQCPNDEAAYQRTVAPLVASLRLKTAVVRRISCTTGFASAGFAGSAISNAILAFRQAGVDRVMFMSDYETVALLLFASSASSQSYTPGYLLSSTAQAEATRPSLPKDQWPQLHGVGISPGGDVALSNAAPTPVESRCLGLARKGGLGPATQNDKTYVYLQCSLFLLLDTALGTTHGSTAPALVMKVISALGTSFVTPGIVGGATRFGAGRYDGPDLVQVFGYMPSCQCLRYQGEPLPAPN